MDEKLDRVDRNGKVVGQITRGEAYKKGYLHPAVNIILINSKGQIYLQRRSSKKSVFPLYWDVSASEHVASGESFKKAARRGLLEELSVRSSVKLLRPKHIQRSRYEKSGEIIQENELVELFGAVYNGRIKIDKNEVDQGEFFSMDKLLNLMSEDFTPWGLDEIKFLLKHPESIDELVR